MPHPLDGTAAEYVWAIPVLPLLGFAINGAISLFSSGRPGPADPGAHSSDHGSSDHSSSLRDSSTSASEEDSSHGTSHHDTHPAGKTEGHAAGPRFGGLVSFVGPIVVLASFAIAVAIFMAMLGTQADTPFVQKTFPWLVGVCDHNDNLGCLAIDWSWQIDRLSMVMVLIITGVGTLIHIFSVGYMREDPGYARYFAYLNLFVFFMLVLVLGASYPVLFVGWEGVGLCSYLLIGFWFSDKANADAGKKAFIVNRIGDFGLLMAMFMIFANMGTLDFAGVFGNATALGANTPLVNTICLFIFLGCVGKSAQIPLYIWLPDAMAGPTPVSALIHAATMVTAGVYLIARSSALFVMAPAASLTVCIIGALTALFAATIGLKQWDIKKVLAYSTVSQLGYMFIGVGAEAYVAGMFHLITHAFFKALLFLGAGSVIYAMHAAYHETHNHDDAQDMRNMGGLRQYMPWTFVLMWIATLAIAGIPPFAGFFSKDEILGTVFARASGSELASAHWFGIPGNVVLYACYAMGLAAALLTAIYMTRLMLYTFHGKNRTGEAESQHLKEAPWVMTGPLVILAALSLVGGFLNVPALLNFLPTETLADWLKPVISVAPGQIESSQSQEIALILVAIAIAIVGISIAVVRLKPDALTPTREPQPSETEVEKVLEHKYYIDEIYDAAIVRPLVWFSRSVLWKGVDGLIDAIVNFSAWIWRGLAVIGSAIQDGQIGVYAWILVAGVIVVLGAFSLTY
ncbi:MAG TPA: NADH-quinone oxidoreductase subunit L [Gemmatimonadaceae bacterium]|nr:NADH-quinone oxidoreductase subunit L [Gemmatimonadaceae bacterium]